MSSKTMLRDMQEILDVVTDIDNLCLDRISDMGNNGRDGKGLWQRDEVLPETWPTRDCNNGLAGVLVIEI